MLLEFVKEKIYIKNINNIFIKKYKLFLWYFKIIKILKQFNIDYNSLNDFLILLQSFKIDNFKYINKISERSFTYLIDNKNVIISLASKELINVSIISLDIQYDFSLKENNIFYKNNTINELKKIIYFTCKEINKKYL